MHAKCKSLLGFAAAGATSVAAVIGAAGGSSAAAVATTQGAARSVQPAAVVAHKLIGQWTSSNWSGYAIGTKTTAKGTYTSISAQWKVPTLKKNTGTKYSAQWIGIDGFTNQNLIQTGTEVDYIGGQPFYGVWWEILPAAETPINKPVKPGQIIKASITENTSTKKWTISISNGVWSFKKTTGYNGGGQSAEWIVEAPEVGGSIATIAHTGRVTFTRIKVNGANPKLTAADSGDLKENGKIRETPSVPSTIGNAFTMGYGAKAPPAPKG